MALTRIFAVVLIIVAVFWAIGWFTRVDPSGSFLYIAPVIIALYIAGEILLYRRKKDGKRHSADRG
jgi:hypothetical protein